MVLHQLTPFEYCCNNLPPTESGTVEDNHEETVNTPLTSLPSTNCEPVQGPSGLNSSPDSPQSPEMLRPFPEAGPRKAVRGRKKRYSVIPTSTPEKQNILAEEENIRKGNTMKRKTR